MAPQSKFPQLTKTSGSLNYYALPERDRLSQRASVKLEKQLSEQKIAEEIIIADDGSTDGSQAIATKLGARLINVREREDIAMPSWVEFWRPEENILAGRCDDSCDFLETPKFPTPAVA